MFVDQVKFSFKRKMFGCLSVGLMLILILTSCFREKVPPGVLTRQEMVTVLTEIYLTEEKAVLTGATYDSVKKIFPKFSAKVFEKTGVADSTFRKSMEYYLANPKKLEYIYSALIDSLNLKAQGAIPKKENALSE